MSARARTFDIVVVGGGLAGQLMAIAMQRLAPGRSLALIERAPALGGNHTWCCHRGDLCAPEVDEQGLAAWFLPLVDLRWPKHRVRFPRYDRVLEGEYLCLRSFTLARHTVATLAGAASLLMTGQEVTAVGRREVVLASGERISAALVLDARGADLAAYAGRGGYQKFLGWEIELDRPAPVLPAIPTLMDATVRQIDGYRFLYVLPFSSTRFLVEDTTFSRSPSLAPDKMRRRVHAYLAERAVTGFSIVREESGVLPMPWAMPAPGPSLARDAALPIGYRGHFFHPGTGYSLARAAIVAHRLAGLAAAAPPDLGTAAEKALAGLRAGWSGDDSFARLLNRVAFRCLPPTWLREAVFAPVYRLRPSTLANFYAGRSRLGDRLALATAPLRLPLIRLVAKPRPLLGEQP